MTLRTVDHHFQACTFQKKKGGEWQHGIAKVSALGLCNVLAVCDLNLKVVAPIYDYQLAIPLTERATGFTITQSQYITD